MRTRRRNPIAEWLHSIRYHSARRETTRWTRAMDIVLFASPVIGLAVAIALDSAPLSERTTVVARGNIERSPRSNRIEIIIEGSPRYERGWGPIPIGTFDVERRASTGGWPLPSSVWHGPVEQWLRRFDEVAIERRLAHDGDDTIVAPLMESLTLGEAGPEAVDLLAIPAGRQRRLLAFAANVGLWWIASYFLLGTSVQCLRVVAWRVETGRRRRRRRMLAEGKCPHCGYDSRGSLWSERCPECGEPLE